MLGNVYIFQNESYDHVNSGVTDHEKLINSEITKNDKVILE